MNVIYINCQVEPFVKGIMDYLKQYETRNRNTLGRFIGERVLIAETGHGDPLVRCSLVIDQVISVTTKEDWDQYLEQTWIPVGSKYDWQPDTKKKWLYHLTDIRPVEPFRLPKNCIRHGRVWAELPDLTNVTYWNSGGNVMCYCALYKGKYWIFGNEDWMGAYSIDVANYDDDPNPYEISNVTDFPTWKEVLNSIPDSVVNFYWESRSAMNDWYRSWQGSLKKRVNEE